MDLISAHPEDGHCNPCLPLRLLSNIHALNDLTERSVASVKMWSSFVHDKELASCRVWIHGSCHGENTWCMLQIVFETVLGKFTFDAVSGATHSVSVGTSALDHKAVDDTVEDQSVVEAFFLQD